VPDIVSLFQQNLDDLIRFSQKPPMSLFAENRPVEAARIRAERRTNGRREQRS